jgi:cytoskeletal protein CcmA (bactofilin family)
MSRTRFQQTQVTGSLLDAFNDSLAAGSSLQGQSDLVGDLNAIRSQVNRIIGVGNWYEALTGSQSLKAIHDALHVVNTNQAQFQSNVEVLGQLTGSSLLINSTSNFIGDAQFQSNVDVLGQLTASSLLVNSASMFGGDARFLSNVEVLGQLTGSSLLINSSSTFVGDAQFKADVDVVGNITASSILINDIATFVGDVQFQANVDVIGQLTASVLLVDQTSTFVGDSQFLSNVDVTGQLTASTLLVNGVSSFLGTATFSSGAYIAGDLVEIGGDQFIVSGSYYVSGPSSFDGNVTVTDRSKFLVSSLYDLAGDRRASFAHGSDFQIYNDGGASVFSVDKSTGNVTLRDTLILGGAGASGSLGLASDGINLKIVSAGQLFITSSGQSFTFAASGDQAAFDAQYPGKTIVGAIVGGGGNIKEGIVVPGVTTGGVDPISFAGVGYLLSSSLADDASKLLALDVYLNGFRLMYGSSYDYTIEDTSHVKLSTGSDTRADDVMLFVIRNAAHV